MAVLTVTSKTSTSISVTISGLSQAVSSYNGFRFRINGGAWRNSTTVSTTFSSLSPFTNYTIQAEAQTNDWYAAGSTSTYTRPSDWNWYTTKTSGGLFNITASEWNAFCTRVNQFRVYKGMSNYSFTTAVTGNAFTYTHYNQIRNAIVNMNGDLPPYRGYNDIINASDINKLRTSLNAIT